MKIIGFKFFKENNILKFGFFLYLINFLGKIISGYLIQNITYRRIFYFFNTVFILGIILRLFFVSSFLNFILPYIIIFLGISFSYPYYFLYCKKIYGNNNLSISLNRILMSKILLGSLLEFIFEIINMKLGINISEIIILILFFWNYLLIYFLKI